MAQKAQSDLSINDLDAVFKRAGKAEKQLMRELTHSGDPRQAVVLTELLHYFPGSRILDEPHALGHDQRPKKGQRGRKGSRRT